MLSQRVPLGQPLIVTLPPGRYLLADPCYVLSERDYEHQHDLVFPTPAVPAAATVQALRAWDCAPRQFNLLLQDPGRGVLLRWATAHGDGNYTAHVGARRVRLSVDSGGLALLDARWARSPGEQREAAVVELTEPLEVHLDGQGNLVSAAVSIYTSYAGEETEEWEEC